MLSDSINTDSHELRFNGAKKCQPGLTTNGSITFGPINAAKSCPLKAQ